MKKLQPIIRGDRHEEGVSTECPVQTVLRAPQLSAQAPAEREAVNRVGEPLSMSEGNVQHTVPLAIDAQNVDVESVCRATPHASPIHTDQQQEGNSSSFLGEVTSQENPITWTVEQQLN